MAKVEGEARAGHQKKLEDVEQVLTSMVMVVGGELWVNSVDLVEVGVRVVLKIVSMRWEFLEAKEGEPRRREKQSVDSRSPETNPVMDGGGYDLEAVEGLRIQIFPLEREGEHQI